MLCDDLEGWDREDGRETQEGGYMGTCVCIWLIHFAVQQKLTQHFKAIILQLKKKALSFIPLALGLISLGTVLFRNFSFCSREKPLRNGIPVIKML